MKNTINHTGKAAVFIRGFMTKYAELAAKEKDIALRVCQDAGLHAVQALDDDISVAYISRLARELVEDNVVSKKKRGRKFYMGPASKTDLFLDWLDDNEDWGAEIMDDATVEVKEKMQILEHMNKHKGILIYADDPLPKAQYSFLMKQFKEGKLNLVFVERDYETFITPDSSEVDVPPEFIGVVDAPTNMDPWDDSDD